MWEGGGVNTVLMKKMMKKMKKKKKMEKERARTIVWGLRDRPVHKPVGLWTVFTVKFGLWVFLRRKYNNNKNIST